MSEGGAANGAPGGRFPAAGYDDWRRRVEEELRGAPFESLVSTLPGGIAVQPLHHQRPWEGDGGPGDDPRGVPGEAPFVRGARPAGESGGWLRCARIDAPDLEAAKAALTADLAGGCDAAWLVLDVEAALADRPEEAGAARGDGVPVGSPEQLEALLEGVDLDRVSVFLDAGLGSRAAAGFLLAALRARGPALRGRRHLLGVDPIGELAASGALLSSLEEAESGMAALAAGCIALRPEARAVSVSALPWHEAGATPAQELGWTLATLARYLRRLEEAGLDPEAVAGQVALRTAVGRDLFLAIAKLRALRWLWSKLFAACGVASPPPPFVHAVSSDRALTRGDPWTNLLRVTIEVFAAVAGGADAITASPYDRLLRAADEPAGSRLGRRIARNTQHVLALEAHLGRVADPAGGSYYLEALTDDLARRAWDELRRVEAAGGIAAHLRSGRLREEAEAAWRERRRRLVEGADPVLGVSVYPPPGEIGDGAGGKRRRPELFRIAAAGGETIDPLPRHRLAEPFEDEGVPPPAGGGSGVEAES